MVPQVSLSYMISLKELCRLIAIMRHTTSCFYSIIDIVLHIGSAVAAGRGCMLINCIFCRDVVTPEHSMFIATKLFSLCIASVFASVIYLGNVSLQFFLV